MRYVHSSLSYSLIVSVSLLLLLSVRVCKKVGLHDYIGLYIFMLQLFVFLSPSHKHTLSHTNTHTRTRTHIHTLRHKYVHTDSHPRAHICISLYTCIFSCPLILLFPTREAKIKTANAQTERGTAASGVREIQALRGAITTERTGLEKKLTGEEILIERQRAQLHEVS